LAKAERQEADATVEHKRQMFLKKELAWVRQGQRAQRSKQKDRFERYYDEAAKDGPAIEEDMELVIPPPPQLGNRTVEVGNLGMTLGDKKLFSGFSYTFENGQRIGVCGRNGLGKTTLLKAIIGQLPPTEGTVKIGQLTKFNYVDQGRLQLNEERSVLDEASDGTEFVIWGDSRISVRSYLKRFLFADDRITTQVKKLSGGERSRLLLAKILKCGGNFLILDEPTNDLDLPTLRVLEVALIAFPGMVLVVSHDRYFLNRVCTNILAFEGDVLRRVGLLHHLARLGLRLRGRNAIDRRGRLRRERRTELRLLPGNGPQAVEIRLDSVGCPRQHLARLRPGRMDRLPAARRGAMYGHLLIVVIAAEAGIE
jgi:ATP-binding cassette subfamily F protein uup